MKKFAILMIAGLATVATGAPAIAAPAAAPGHGYNAPMQGGWQNINARQANLEARINQGIRRGTISRREAGALRAEFNGIARLEAQFRRSRPGLTMSERRILDQRFDVLSRKIRVEANDRNGRRGGGYRG
jgi:hypothetical protein